MAAATHINGCYPGFHEETTATPTLLPDGRVELACALHDLGCGADTTQAQIAGEVLRLTTAEISIVTADTDSSPYDLGTRASRMTYICGEAVRCTAGSLAAAIKAEAVLEPNAMIGELHLEGNAVHRSDGSSLDLAELARRVGHRGCALPSATETYRASANPGSYAVHFAEVEIDSLTGRVRVIDYLAAHDVGRAINPMLVEGQVHGGIQIGIGYALYEDVAIDPSTGRMRADSFSR